MTAIDLMERLRAHRTLGDAPGPELAWLADHGRLRRFEKGAVVTGAGEEVEGLYVVLTGHLAIHIDWSYGRRKVMEWRGGDVTGVLPFSRLGASPGDVRAKEPTEVLMLPRAGVQELPAACPEMTAILVHVMTDRARHFTSADLNDRRALALGKVAAGLAHELNNPASALIRSAKTLVETLEAQWAGGGAWLLDGLDGPARDALNRLYRECREEPSHGWDALERADRERSIEEWLDRSVDQVAVAGVLADTAVPLDTFFELADVLPPEAAADALAHVASVIFINRLAEEMEHGASRIFHLVSAVKRFTHMDQAMTMEPVDVNAGLRDAATLLGEKARAAGVTVRFDVPPTLPSVVGAAEGLNQMWHALLDNALDAAAPDGEVVITGDSEDGEIWIEIRDTGPGIPEDHRDRIFDPFFTTKPVGRGIGLGLELVRRVLDQHRGEVDVTSGLDGTAFRVSLRA